MPRKEIEAQISKLVLADLDLQKRDSQRSIVSDAPELAERSLEVLDELKLVYTAFDGDHQHLVPLMRRAVMAAGGRVPVNPDSVLDYRETLSSRMNKRFVLVDDLSIVKGCDELWIFTDMLPGRGEISDLAEGVLVELLFFLKRHEGRPVHFVEINSLLRCGPPQRVPWEKGFQETKKLLANDQRREVLEIANGTGHIDDELSRVRYYITDLADFKYARFLLPDAYKESRDGGCLTVPLVPYLALQLSDAKAARHSLGTVALGWAKLLSLAQEVDIVSMAEPSRAPSLLMDWLREIWTQQLTAGSNMTTTPKTWAEFGIPKMHDPEGWAITARERKRYRPKEL